MADLRCFSCHAINGHGGDMAPDLSWEGSAVQRAWLAEFLHNPETLRPALIRRMPKFNLTADEINTLTDYMMVVYQTPTVDRDSMPAPGSRRTWSSKGANSFTPSTPASRATSSLPRRTRDTSGRRFGRSGPRLNAAWVYAYLKNPPAMRPGTLEPDQHLSDAEARNLTAFLMAQKSAKEAGKK